MEYFRGRYRLAALVDRALLLDNSPRRPAATANITNQIMWHVFETLYTFDKDWGLIPHLAEGHMVSKFLAREEVIVATRLPPMGTTTVSRIIRGVVENRPHNG